MKIKEVDCIEATKPLAMWQYEDQSVAILDIKAEQGHYILSSYGSNENDKTYTLRFRNSETEHDVYAWPLSVEVELDTFFESMDSYQGRDGVRIVWIKQEIERAMKDVDFESVMTICENKSP